MKTKLEIVSILFLFLVSCTSVESPNSTSSLAQPTSVPTSTITFTPTLPHTITLSPTSTQSPVPFASWCPVQTPSYTSSSGKLAIAYIRDIDYKKDAWLWTENASTIRLTTWGDLDWIDISDDGMYVAYTRQNVPNQVWVIRSDGSNERVLVNAMQFAEMHKGSMAFPTDLHWVPGTHMIAFHTNPAPDEFGFVYNPDNLWWVDAESGQYSEKPVDGEIFYSPDGKRAAVVNQRHLILMNPDGSDQRIVNLENYHTIPSEAFYRVPPRVHWADDSMSLYVIAPEGKNVFEALAPTALVTIWRVNWEDAQPEKAGIYNAAYTPINFSPDHKFVTYYRQQNETSASGDLHLTQIGGVDDIIISSSGATYASWSPDSQHYIFEDSGIFYLGDVCNKPMPLLKEPLIGEDNVIVSGWVEWINAYQYLLMSFDYTLYLGRIDQSEQPQKLFDGDIVKFDWVVIR